MRRRSVVLSVTLLVVLVFAAVQSSPAQAAYAEWGDGTLDVYVGEYAWQDVWTYPGDTCTFTYWTPAGTRSTARGLGTKTADRDGFVTWEWFIGTSTRPGRGTIEAACRSGGTIREVIYILP